MENENKYSILLYYDDDDDDLCTTPDTHQLLNIGI